MDESDKTLRAFANARGHRGLVQTIWYWWGFLGWPAKGTLLERTKIVENPGELNATDEDDGRLDSDEFMTWENYYDPEMGSYAEAVRRGDAVIVQSWLSAAVDDSQRRKLLGYMQATHEAPLHVAAKSGSADLIDVLLNGADRCGILKELVDVPDGEKRTPLFYAVFAGHHAIAAALLSHGATAGRRQPLPRRHPGGAPRVGTVLHLAAEFGSEEMVSLLLHHGATTSAKDTPDGNTPLLVATTMKMARLLLAAGAQHDAHNRAYEMPIDLVEARLRRAESLERLIGEIGGKGAVLLVPDGDEFIRVLPDRVAKDREDAVCLVNLLNAQDCVQELRQMSRQGWGSSMEAFEDFQAAVAAGDGKRVRKRLSQFGQVEYSPDEHLLPKREHPLLKAKGHDGLRAVDRAASRGHVDVLCALLDFGCPPDPRHMEDTPLYRAVEAGQTDAVRMLLERGADPSRDQTPGGHHFARDGRRVSITALHKAVERDDVEIAHLLLRGKADPNSLDRPQCRPPLHLAGSAAMVSLLVDSGASVFLTDADGVTPLEALMARGSLRSQMETASGSPTDSRSDPWDVDRQAVAELLRRGAR